MNKVCFTISGISDYGLFNNKQKMENSFLTKYYLLFQSHLLFHRNYSSSAPTTKLFIDGQFLDSKTNKWIELTNPATNEVIGR